MQNRNTTRLRLKDDEFDLIQKYRRIKEESIAAGINPDDVKHGWLKTDKSSLFFKNPNFKTEEKNKFAEDLIKELEQYSPTYPTIKHKKSNNGHLLVIDIADLHINKYAEAHLTGADYNSKIAVNRAIEGTKGLIQKASGFNVEKVVFVIGNDVLNTDNLSRSTTKFTPQDTDVNWFKAFNIAKDCYIKCIELCMQVANVDIIHCPSNHDEMTGCLLAQTLQAWFRQSKNLTFNISPKYRKYYQFHNSMLEFEHGHRGKMANLPLQMANEEPQMWANTKFRYAYLHHVHHQDKTQFKSGKDFTGCNVTYLRSPSSADLWHAESGYDNMVAVEAFLHSKDMGRVAHLTHYF
jgi:hypothetical protein